MKVNLYNIKNEIVGQIDLADGVFGVHWNPDLVQQVLQVQLANRRQPLAHAKDRSEVRGGGKKPWRQKGTGRARHGSIRSPLWKGGGVTFGPTKERNFARKVNKKMVRKALYSLLSKKLSDGELKIIDTLALPAAKTKILFQILRDLQTQSVLLIPQIDSQIINRAARNLPNVKTVSPIALNVYDLLRYRNIIVDQAAAVVIK